MKRAAIYARVSTADQSPASQLYDLRQMAAQRGLEVVGEYIDHGISGTKNRRPGLDSLMTDARHGKFDIVLIWAADRIARSVHHFIETLEELQHLNVAFLSYREQIDTSGPLGKAVMVIVGAIAELERSLIVERVKAGMRRARLEGRRIGRTPLPIDQNAILLDRQRGRSLTEIATAHRISRALVSKVLRRARNAGHEGVFPSTLAPEEDKQLRPPKSAA
jgi:DNA invertase Pin-like site-specific DNA recombinase